MAEQRDVQALAETIREYLSKSVNNGWSTVSGGDARAALDELVLEHTRQEAFENSVRDALDFLPHGNYRRCEPEKASGILHAALAALSPPPVASGENER